MVKKTGDSKKPKPTRSETLGLRLDPRMKYALELLSRAQRRSISGTVEWCVERALKSEMISTELTGADLTFEDLTHRIWDVDPYRQLVNLCAYTPKLATFEELQRYRVLTLTDGMWFNSDNVKDASNFLDANDPLALGHLIHDIIESGRIRGLTSKELVAVGVIPF
jgi:hypothetical protein